MSLQVLLIKIPSNMVLKHQMTLKKPIKNTQNKLKTLKGLEACVNSSKKKFIGARDYNKMSMVS